MLKPVVVAVNSWLAPGCSVMTAGVIAMFGAWGLLPLGPQAARRISKRIRGMRIRGFVFTEAPNLGAAHVISGMGTVANVVSY